MGTTETHLLAGESPVFAPSQRPELGRKGRGLRLHLVCTLHGLPVMFALAGAKAGEREVLLGMPGNDAELVAERPGQTVIGDENYFGRDFERQLADGDPALLRPVRKGEDRSGGRELFKPLRQVIESVNWSFKGQLDLEEHGGRTDCGIFARVLVRVLALTAGIAETDGRGRRSSRRVPGRSRGEPA